MTTQKIIQENKALKTELEELTNVAVKMKIKLHTQKTLFKEMIKILLSEVDQDGQPLASINQITKLWSKVRETII